MYSVKMKSLWMKVGPNPTTSVLVRGGTFGHRHRHTGECHVTGETGVTQAEQHQGLLATPGSKEEAGKNPIIELSETAWFCQHLHLGLPVPRTVVNKRLLF